jgi:uncharacterized UPF0146 family protein
MPKERAYGVVPGREMKRDAVGVATKVNAKLAVKREGSEDVPALQSDHQLKLYSLLKLARSDIAEIGKTDLKT